MISANDPGAAHLRTAVEQEAQKEAVHEKAAMQKLDAKLALAKQASQEVVLPAVT